MGKWEGQELLWGPPGLYSASALCYRADRMQETFDPVIRSHSLAYGDGRQLLGAEERAVVWMEVLTCFRAGVVMRRECWGKRNTPGGSQCKGRGAGLKAGLYRMCSHRVVSMCSRWALSSQFLSAVAPDGFLK